VNFSTSPLEQLPNTYRPFFGRFSALTAAQKALIRPVLDGQDVILQAGTGSGKTEAILAPATERLVTSPDPFTILYVVPTRALALDMNRRITFLYRQLGLRAGFRTGDGKTLRDRKPHLLILTPESLDVLIGSQNEDNRYFLKHLRILIFDEAHIFLKSARGKQLSYLRHRLEMQAAGALQTVALSATIPNLEEVAVFFKLKNVFYYRESAVRKLQSHWVHLEDEAQELVPFFDDLSLRWGCRKLLVFANSRKKCEQLLDLLNQEGFFSKHVLLHYSNLSTKERRAIECSFRNNKRSVCIATSTLEMGIDIGDVDGVVLVGPPPSAMAFLQRIGRANRRHDYVNFWGICQGAYAGRQLLQFLAMFELSQEGQMEQYPTANHYSVLFQQVLSCLYARKRISQASLDLLFNEEIEACRSIFDNMAAGSWLMPMRQPGLYTGGWRYVRALRQQQIWSNFPPTEEEYEVILGREKIAVLPLSAVRQLEIGNLIQLTGRVLKILQIEEKKTSREVWVEESDAAAEKELLWIGLEAPISFEVAQKMGAILSEKRELPGLFNRTRRLLEEERNRIEEARFSPRGFRAHRLANGAFRYETFLGSIGNLIIYHLIKTQLLPQIKGLSVRFDELGIECNKWIPFESLKFPDRVSSFQEWVSSHLSLLRETFSWNSWIRYLPNDYQCKEISSHLLDMRILAHFERYGEEGELLTCPEYPADHKKPATQLIPLAGVPRSFENEKKEWGRISFPELPVAPSQDRCLTATLIQGYVNQNLCSRWARLQNLSYVALSHPRFQENDQMLRSRKEEGIVFKKQVIESLGKKASVYWETEEFTWKWAIQKVISDGKPLFLAQARLEADSYLRGRPDLIYFKHEGSRICWEIWDIKKGYTFSYAQKWRIAFYVCLLESLLQTASFSLPVKGSDLGGLVYCHADQEKLFDRTPFILAHYKKWMPRLIANWKKDSTQTISIEKYSMGSSCVSCCYFSYCYQETLFKDSLPPENQGIVSLGIKSNDFPKNTRQWFFMYSDREGVRWQRWERGELVHDTRVDSERYANKGDFWEEAVKLLQKQWRQAIDEGKNPHFLVYEPADWYLLPGAFQKLGEWTSIQSVLQKHFQWPVSGRLTATQIALCLGFISDPPPPLSLYHKEFPTESLLDLYRRIWNWILSQVKSRRVALFDGSKIDAVPLIRAYFAVQRRESESRVHEILEFQKKTLPERVDLFRAIGPLTFVGPGMEGKQKCYLFALTAELPLSKFRIGDFLKLSPVGSSQIQNGFSVILESYSPEKKTLSVRSLSKKMWLGKEELYALDEDTTDWNGPKIEKVLNLLKNPKFRPDLVQILHGQGKSFSPSSIQWVEEWILSDPQSAGLNLRQKEALTLPFLKSIGLIEGPPGTGKTHLLVWTVMALAAHARSLNRPIKILITAQTHQAIDQILKKIAAAFSQRNGDMISLWKYGRYDFTSFSSLGIRSLQECEPLLQDSSLILGATGFGIYQLLDGKNFPQLFDWVVFDESSQVLPSYALLSLIFGKGNALFYGDTQQLPPVLKGRYDFSAFVPRSILAELISRFGDSNRVRLNETYRMNDLPVFQ
jgi:replicative superfamily II helicase